MNLQTKNVTLTTDASGNASVDTAPVKGRIFSVIYNKDDFADGVDFNLSTKNTNQNVWVENDVNAAKSVSPRQPLHDTSGAGSLYASGGEPVEGHIYAVDEPITITVANGGDTKSGSFTIIYG